MRRNRRREFLPDWTMRPGVHLQEMLDYAGLHGRSGIRYLKKATGLDEGTVIGVLYGTVEIDDDIAARLATGAQPLAVSKQFWLNLEQNYRDALARGASDLSDEMLERKDEADG